MILKITDGTTTVTLNDDSGTPTVPFVGVRYFPLAGTGATVVDTATVAFSGSNSVLKTQVNRIEALLEQAKHSHLPTVYMEYHHNISGYQSRSPLVGGRVVWSDERAKREVYQGNAFGEFDLIFERANYWEGPEEAAAAMALIRNGDTSPYNDVNLNTISGALPTPLKVTINNNVGGGSMFTNKFYLGIDQIDLDGTEHMLNGGSTSWGSAINHSTRLFTLPIPTDFLDKTQGRDMHILAGFSSLVASFLYLKASVYTSIGGIHILAHAGNEKEVGNRKLINLGTLPIPPGGVANSEIALCITGYSTNPGSATLDFVQLIPATNSVELTQTGYQINSSTSIVEDGIEEVAYTTNGTVRYQIIQRSGGPLLAYPQRNNRLYVLFDEGNSFNASKQMTVTVNYRARRITI